MKKLYTAVGQLHFRGNADGNRCPILVVNGKETTPNMSEMILWSTLYWQILNSPLRGSLSVWRHMRQAHFHFQIVAFAQHGSYYINPPSTRFSSR